MDERDLMDKLQRLSTLAQRSHNRRFRRYGPLASPHKGQGRVLALLQAQPEVSQKELGRQLGMRGPSLGELLAKLEDKEYITRTPSEIDRRGMVVRLTPEGTAAAGQMAAHAPDADSVLGCLNNEEQERLAGDLDRLIAALEEQLAEPPKERPAQEVERKKEGWGHRPMGISHLAEAPTPGSAFDRRQFPGQIVGFGEPQYASRSATGPP